MAYTRKTYDEWVIMTYYGRQYGWEEVSSYTASDYNGSSIDARKAAREDVKEYRMAEPEARHKVIKRRMHIEPVS